MDLCEFKANLEFFAVVLCCLAHGGKALTYHFLPLKRRKILVLLGRKEGYNESLQGKQKEMENFSLEKRKKGP